MMASIIEILPLETIDQIIDLIADDDINDKSQYELQLRNTRACFLTCSTFASRCRRRIYHSVILVCGDTLDPERDPNVPSLARSFAELITRTPEIAEHVCELVCHIPPHTPDRPMPPIPTALGHLKNLQKLSISRFLTGVFDWGELVRSDSWALIFGLMCGPNMSSLEFNGAKGFRISDLVGCSAHLKSLTLRKSRLNEAKDLLPLPNNVIEITELNISLFMTSVTNLLKLKYMDGTPVLDRKALRRISIMALLSNHDAQDTVQLLNLTTNLEYLRLRCSSFCSFSTPDLMSEPPASLLLLVPMRLWRATIIDGTGMMPSLLSTPLRTLRHLSLRLTAENFSTLRHTQDVPQLLKSISAQNHIEILTFHMTVFDYLHGQARPSKGDEWEALKECVSHLNCWSCLRRVELEMEEWYEGSRTSRGPVAFIRLGSTDRFVEVL